MEDDLSQRYGRRLLEVSPQNLLTEGYIQDKTGDTFVREFRAYLTKVEDEEGVYRARLDSLWEERFPELGYREFKQKLNNGTLWEGSRAVSVGKHEVLLKEDTPAYGFTVQKFGDDAENRFVENERPFR